MSSSPHCFQEHEQASRDQAMDSARRGGPENNAKLTYESENSYFIPKARRTLKLHPPFPTHQTVILGEEAGMGVNT